MNQATEYLTTRHTIVERRAAKRPLPFAAPLRNKAAGTAFTPSEDNPLEVVLTEGRAEFHRWQEDSGLVLIIARADAKVAELLQRVYAAAK